MMPISQNRYEAYRSSVEELRSELSDAPDLADHFIGQSAETPDEFDSMFESACLQTAEIRRLRVVKDIQESRRNQFEKSSRALAASFGVPLEDQSDAVNPIDHYRPRPK